MSVYPNFIRNYEKI